MKTLTLPQARIPLGHVMVQGQRLPVEIDMEWMRALLTLVNRTGGVLGVEDFGFNAFASSGDTSATANGISFDAVAQQQTTVDFVYPDVLQPASKTREDGEFLKLDVSKDVTLSGTGQRIKGDFTNALRANQVIAQTSVLNGDTNWNIAPNGTSFTSQFYAINATAFTDYSYASMQVNGVDARLTSGKAGTGTFLPWKFFTTDIERMRITAGGNVAIDPLKKLFLDGVAATGDTYLLESSANVLDAYVGGANALKLTATTATVGALTTTGGATFHTTSSALTNGAAAAVGTLTNAPAAGNPSKWIGINDNGTTRYLPAW